MEIPGRKIAVDLGPYIQEKMREAQEKSRPQKVRKKTSPGASSESGEVRKQTGHVDEVRISAQARDVQKVRAEMDKAPEVRAEKVEKLKAALSRETYRVEGKEIADKMLQEHLTDLIL